MQEEVWRDVVGYEGKYAVSNFGNVKSLPRRSSDNRLLSGRILKPRKSPNGYLHVALYKDNVSTQINVHRLVMRAFVGPSDLQVNHKDEDKTNNRLDNLEYMTGYDNTRYSCSKPVESYDIKTGETVKAYMSISDVAVDGYSPTAVSGVCLKKYGYKSHRGLGWRYIDVERCGKDRTNR